MPRDFSAEYEREKGRMDVVRIRIPDTLKEAYRLACERTGETMTAPILRAIEQYIDEH